ncbi:hypothetical protein M9Y10_009519 [Tritrichomonas musculus]|uniref:non-specific serine/threonine protein kinase n=1 Tax=Tritrichomonas musculus TaxID=1915356 RepID=A0ABR2INK7_9EUKA
MDHREIDESIVREMNIDGLEVLDWIGSGNFSNVFKGILNNDTEVAIKVISQDDSALNHELNILSKIKGCPNTTQIIDSIPSSKDYPIIIMEYKKGISSKDLLNNLTLPHIKYILQSLLKSLDSIHHNSIVHQDVKLSNLIVSTDYKEITLSDWGCAHVVSNNLSPLVGTRLYRSPEMLIGAKNYRTAGDIWAVGVTILYILSNDHIPWNSPSSDKELIEMSKFFGGNNLANYAENVLHLNIKPGISKNMVPDATEKLDKCFSDKSKSLQDPQLIDLMNQLLTLDMTKRPSAETALQHAFFK